MQLLLALSLVATTPAPAPAKQASAVTQPAPAKRDPLLALHTLMEMERALVTAEAPRSLTEELLMAVRR